MEYGVSNLCNTIGTQGLEETSEKNVYHKKYNQ